MKRLRNMGAGGGGIIIASFTVDTWRYRGEGDGTGGTGITDANRKRLRE